MYFLISYDDANNRVLTVFWKQISRTFWGLSSNLLQFLNLFKTAHLHKHDLNIHIWQSYKMNLSINIETAPTTDTSNNDK